jgi:hypothetical protein
MCRHMTVQISRAFLFFMMLLTGLSAVDAACPDAAQRQGAEELSLVSQMDTAIVGTQLAGHAAVSNDEPAVVGGFAAPAPIYAVTAEAFSFSTPPSRHDLARE